jgi:tetratricopeptide (TPR) repeat protein
MKRLTAAPVRILPLLLVVAGCVYFNAMYDAGKAYDAGMQAQREGRDTEARWQFDSVIAKAGRIVTRHPDSKYADDAALLKARSEIHNQLWQSARESAALAERLAARRADSAVAVGLGGIAELGLERPGEADERLTAALAEEVPPDDRALFLFQRGLARFRLERPAEAAADLEEASGQIDLSDEARLELARALFRIGELERSAAVASDLLRRGWFGTTSSAISALVDSLSAAAPGVMDERLAELLADEEVPASQRAMLWTLRGRTLDSLGRTEEALVLLDSASRASGATQWGPTAAFDAARIRIRTADEPDELREALPDLQRAVRSVDAATRTAALPLEDAARRFDALTDAWRTRGGTAAEAALRAAEVAGSELGSPAVARGLYLKYLELAPDSPWAAKAIYGALAYAGHAPGGDWVRDGGGVTDAALQRQLADLPPEDPYRAALDPALADDWSDSAYVLAEADLRNRITEIQMLFDTTVVRVRRDTAVVPDRPQPVDTVRKAPGEADESDAVEQ